MADGIVYTVTRLSTDDIDIDPMKPSGHIDERRR